MQLSTVRLGAVAYHPRVHLIWEAFEQWFAAHGVRLAVRFYEDYDDQVQGLLDRDVHLAWNTNLAYVQALMRTGGGVQALAMRDTDLYWTSHVVVPGASPVRDLADLRGLRLGFGDADSPQAHILPVHALRAAGLDPARDVRPSRLDRDLGKHGDTGGAELAQLARMRAGLLDACVISSVTLSTLQGLAEGAGNVRSVWTSPSYSHCNFTALDDTAPRAAGFVDLLLTMDAGDPRLCEPMQLEYVQQWVRCDGARYEDLVSAVAAGWVVVGTPPYWPVLYPVA